MSTEYLTTAELAGRLKYDERTIREKLMDSVLLEGVHYLRPFGRRKILFIWQAIEEDLSKGTKFSVPMANGGVLHGQHSHPEADRKTVPGLLL